MNDRFGSASWVLFLFIALGTAIAQQASPQPAATAKDPFALVVEGWNAKTLLETAHAFDAVLKQQPDWAILHSHLGEMYFWAGDTSRALSEFKQAIDGGALVAQARLCALLAETDLAAAESVCQKELADFPQSSEAQTAFALYRVRMKDLKGAVRPLEIALRQNPDDPFSKELLQWVRQQQASKQSDFTSVPKYKVLGDRYLSRWVLEFGAFFQKRFTFQNLNAVLGSLQSTAAEREQRAAREKDQKQFLAGLYEEALRMDPTNVDAQAMLAVAIRDSDHPRSEQLITDACKRRPLWTECVSRSAAVYKDTDPAKQLEILTRARDLAPDNEGYASLLASEYQRRGRYADRINVLRNLATHNVGNVYMRNSLVNAVWEFAERCETAPSPQCPATLQADAQREAQEAVRLFPNDARAHEKLGRILERRNGIVAALPEYHASVRLDPVGSFAFSPLQLYYEKTKAWPELIALHRQRVNAKPDMAELHAGLADALNRSGDKAGSVAEYRAAVALDPRSDSLQLYLGWALEAAQDPKGALAAYQAAVTINPKNDVARGQYDFLASKMNLPPLPK